MVLFFVIFRQKLPTGHVIMPERLACLEKNIHRLPGTYHNKACLYRLYVCSIQSHDCKVMFSNCEKELIIDRGIDYSKKICFPVINRPTMSCFWGKKCRCRSVQMDFILREERKRSKKKEEDLLYVPLVEQLLAKSPSSPLINHPLGWGMSAPFTMPSFTSAFKSPVYQEPAGFLFFLKILFA